MITRIKQLLWRGKLSLSREQENIVYRLRRNTPSAGQRRVIEAIHELSTTHPEPAKTSDIARLAGVHQTYVQRMLIPLELSGYITVLRDTNGKAYQTGCIINQANDDTPYILGGIFLIKHFTKIQK